MILPQRQHLKILKFLQRFELLLLRHQLHLHLKYSLGNATFNPFLISLPISDVKSTSSTGALVESLTSAPEIASNTIALSFTFESMDQFGLMKMQKQLIQIEIHDRMLVSYRQRHNMQPVV